MNWGSQHSEGLGSAVSSPGEVWGGVPAAERFSCILEAQDGPPRT